MIHLICNNKRKNEKKMNKKIPINIQVFFIDKRKKRTENEIFKKRKEEKKNFVVIRSFVIIISFFFVIVFTCEWLQRTWIDTKMCFSYELPNTTFIFSTISLSWFTTKYSIKFLEIWCWSMYSKKLNKQIIIIKTCISLYLRQYFTFNRYQFPKNITI